jgi:RNA binding exosome subunit
MDWVTIWVIEDMREVLVTNLFGILCGGYVLEEMIETLDNDAWYKMSKIAKKYADERGFYLRFENNLGCTV